ncbi:MAG: hypothetical protein C5B51_21930 [Terriglobia bacterium]|nr:MAG: hypothetical protein C5B51_21930 [Terriglobia bacterium]
MIRPIVVLGLLTSVAPGVLAQPKIVGVVNAASSQAGLPYGGALATAYVAGLSGLKPGTYTAPQSQALPYLLGGVGVLVNGRFAPVLAVAIPSDASANVQVNFQVPSERNAAIPGSSTFVGSALSVTSTISSADMIGLPAEPSWGGFFSDANGYAAALHASDSSPVTVQNPARPGETIIAYADDFFITWPPPPIGIAVPGGVQFQILSESQRYLYLQEYPKPTACGFPENPLTCTNSVTSTPALQISFKGLAAGKVGVEEIDFVVPANQQAGTRALFFNSGSCPDGSGLPGTCGAQRAGSSPYVLLPVGGSPVTAGLVESFALR